MKKLDERKKRLTDGLDPVRRRIAELETMASEYRRLKSALRESEDNFRKTFNASPNVIIITTLKEGRVVDISEPYCRLIGYTREEVIGHTTKELSIWADPATRDAIIRMLRDKGRVDDWEVEQRTKSGEIRTLIFSGEVITLNKEKCLLSSATDITERKMAEKALRDSEQRHRSTLDNMLEGCQIIGFDWRYLYINETAARHGNRTPEEILGHTMMEMYPGIEKTEVFASIKRCMEKRTHYTMDNLFEFGDGTSGWFTLRIEPVPEGVFILSQNITESKRAHESLEKAEAAYRELFGTMPSGVAVYEAVDGGADFVFKDVNRSVEKIEKIKKKDIIGRRITDVFPGIKEIGLLGVFQRVWQTGAMEYLPAAMYRDARALGSWRENWVYKLPGGDIVAVYNDVTRRKQAEIRVDHLNRILGAIRNVNQLIIHEHDAQNLIDESCKLLVANKGYRAAVIVFSADSGLPKVCAPSDESAGFKRLREQMLKGNLPLCCKIASQHSGVYKVKPRTEICAACPVEPTNLEDSILIAPLKHGSSSYGYLMVLVEKELKIDREEKGLLAELAGDISLGLHNIFLEAKRVEMQKILKMSEEKFRDLYDNAPIAYYSVGVDGFIKDTNQAICGMLGYSFDEMEQMHFDDLYAEESKFKAADLLGKLRQGIVITDEEVVYLRKDGHRIYGLLSVTPIRDDHGNITASRSVVKDITARKKAEQALLMAEENFRNSMDNSPLGIRIITKDGETLYANKALLDIYGYENLAGLNSRPAEERYTPESYIEEMERRKKWARGESLPDVYNLDIVRKDGTIRHLLVFRKEVMWNGQPQIQVLCSDVTEHIMAQQAFIQSEAKYSALVESSNDGIVIIQDGVFKFANTRVYNTINLSADDLIGKPFLRLFPKQYRAKVAGIYKRRMAGKSVPTHYEAGIVTNDGKEISVEISASIIQYEGRPADMAIIRDISERKQAEAALMNESTRRRVLLDQSRDGIVILDQNGKVYEANRHFTEMLGYSPEEVLKLHIWDWDTQWNREQLLEMLHDVTEAGDHFETQHRRKDGTVYDVEISSNGAFVDGQKFVFCVNRDVTDRKKAEAEIRNLAKFPSENPSPVLRISSDGTILHANKASDVILSTMGKKVGQSVPKDWHELVRETIDAGTAKTMDIESNERTFALSLAPVVEAGYINVYGSDITERKKAEEVLKESEERYRAFIESTHELVQSVDADGRFRFVNKAWRNALGYSLNDLKNITLYDVIHPDSLEHCGKLFRKVMSGKPVIVPEAAFRKKDGTVLYVEGNATPRRMAGDVIATQGFFRDITERKQAAADLEKSYLALKKTLNDAINAMAKIVEMRDPYTAGHQQRVAQLALAIAGEMNLNEAQKEHLWMAAIVHDIGKIYVPSDILNKPGKLSDLEFQIIKTHPQGGYDIVKDMELPHVIAQSILQHHERLDGSGYPQNLTDKDIIVEARIMAVADVVEAMASHRPYRPSLGLEKALAEILRNRGILYDAEAVDACNRLFEEKRFTFE